ncbi:MAG: endonuclease domain-containing protein [Clostridia bacterium]|nr:endonuclease domain-containing protein [Clostridia bacterium]
MQRKHNRQLVPLAKQLRSDMTKEERHLWYDYLRSYPVRFMRQKVLGHYIADFYCAKAHLVVELDGSQHYTDENLLKDAERTRFLEGYDLQVLRISNNQINQNFEGVCLYIDAAVKQALKKKADNPSVSASADSSLCTREPFPIPHE